MISKSDILPLKEVTRIYISKCYELCGFSKSEMAKRLKISVRTARNYCQMYKLDSKRPSKQGEVNQSAPEENVYNLDFDCIQFVTTDERDAWYNKDYY